MARVEPPKELRETEKEMISMMTNIDLHCLI